MAIDKRKSILIVDDMLLNRRLMGRLVQSFGFHVLTAEDGTAAIAQYQQRNDLFCILMDVQMPLMDGLQATKTIRGIEAAASTPQLRRVPIVGVSACTEEDQLKSTALQGLPIDPATEAPWQVVGMDQFVQKPVSKDKLRAALDAIMEAEDWQRYPTGPPCSIPGPTMGSHAGSPSCGAFASMTGGVDIKVCSRAGGHQVVKRSLGGCMMGSSSAGLPEPAEKRARTGPDAGAYVPQSSRLVACQQPAA